MKIAGKKVWGERKKWGGWGKLYCLHCRLGFKLCVGYEMLKGTILIYLLSELAICHRIYNNHNRFACKNKYLCILLIAYFR